MSLIRRNESYPAWSNFLNEFFDRDWMDWNNRNFSNTNTTFPSVNVKESADGFEVDMAAPGLEKKDFNSNLLPDSCMHEQWYIDSLRLPLLLDVLRNLKLE